jgi:Helix-turn-helix domain of resolvase
MPRRGRDGGCREGFLLLMPPRPKRHIGELAPRTRGQTVAEILRLHALGDSPETIAGELALYRADVTSFLAKQAALEVAARRRRRRAAVPAPRVAPGSWQSTWSRRHVPDGVTAGDVPAIAAADVPELADVELDQVDVTLPAVNVWTGPAGFHRQGLRSLSDDNVTEARELLTAGASYPDVARRFNVSVNTVRRYVTDVGPREGRARAPALCACGCGTPLTERRSTFARGHRRLMREREAALLCACGCGTSLPRTTSGKYRSQFARGHHWKKRREETPLPCPAASCPEFRQKHGNSSP